ncbi:hypothetical protein [Muricoccus pecuniae]|uniref:Tripartite-type tricarboxylate transporter, receptor component TctC n=1 Tax=Muricoccus pecuniae TaxID=693023 RepID=A0A840YFT3_9PROT|nr:hypothetical protein [Roseomonas pecuniae]MBB5692763.1 hypothetical protein [Roseomonas pecuniae]
MTDESSPRPRLPSPVLGRRAAGMAALSLVLPALRPGRARAQAQDTGVVLVPGPEDAAPARWASRAAAALSRGLHRPGALRLSHLGGPDGVTAANRFATLEGAESVRFLALPGWACHVRLTGATRARFEPGAWIPLLVSWHGAVLAGRGPLNARGPAPLRVAIPSPDSPEAAALAALDLLGIPARPVPGMAEAAFAAGEADALIVSGADPVARASMLGATPWCALGQVGEGEAGELPVLTGEPSSLRGVLAAAAGMQMRAALVMPPLTPADTLAAWRRAALRWQEEERSQPGEGHALTGTAAAAAFALAVPPPDATLTYRSWLERRLGWRAA